MSDLASYPRLAAATRNFTLGRPRTFAISPGGDRVLFLRSAGGVDPVQRLWALDPATGDETLLVDPAELTDGPGGPATNLPPEERARRERAREQAGGIVRFATDRAVDRAVFSLGTAAWLTDVRSGHTRRLPLDGAVVDPRLDPTGRHIAWVHDGSLRVTELEGMVTRTLVGEDAPHVTWGLADFVAAEEMGRSRGYWWSPEGDRLLVARVDTAAVHRWWIAQPVDPADAPRQIAYPAAGTANAEVRLALIGLDGARHVVTWDSELLPYLAAVHWNREGPPLVTVQSRDQRRVVHLAVEVPGGPGAPRSPGSTRTVRQQTASPWVELIPGVPRWHGGDLVTVEDDVAADTRRVALAGAPVSPAGLHVREVLEVADGTAVIRASADDATHVGLWRIDLSDGTTTALSPTTGVTAGAVRGGVTISTHTTMDHPIRTTVHTPEGTRTLTDHSATSPIEPRAQRLVLGPRQLQACLLRPAGAAADEPLPVLVDTYGGPHVQRVLQAQALFRTPQWFAEQGFAVLVVDGRGTPGRGLAWEQAVHHDLADGVLADQVEALHEAAGHTAMDLSRVAVRGWSFGGFLAALAVLRRPDVFTAAIAGAPVTDWRLYDTHYTERYLGDPTTNPAVYQRNSLLRDAAALERPLLLIHGLADDNVVAAHTLRLSRALLEAGRPHEVLPLSGVTHMTPQQVVAENLLHLQVDFLRRSLPTDG